MIFFAQAKLKTWAVLPMPFPVVSLSIPLNSIYDIKLGHIKRRFLQNHLSKSNIFYVFG